MAVIKEKGRWILHETAGKTQWTAEMSELANDQEANRCPVCSHQIKLGHTNKTAIYLATGTLIPVWQEQEITMWKGTCCCGTELVVFND